jgi:hypothetical protein
VSSSSFIEPVTPQLLTNDANINNVQEESKQYEVESARILKESLISDEESEVRDNSISDVTDQEPFIKVTKMASIDRSKSLVSKSMSNFNQISISDPTKELDQVWNLMKVHTSLSNWAIHDHSNSLLTPDIENIDVGAFHKSIQRIEHPRVNYELLDKKVTSTTGKRFSNFYLTKSGRAYSSGKNICGILGRDITKQANPFYVQHTIQDQDVKFKSVNSGLKHAVALGQNNKIYTWGYNMLGQLGFYIPSVKESLKTEINFETGESFSYWQFPDEVPFFSKNIHTTIVTKISCGDNFTIAGTSSGKLYGWGDNTFNQLGIPNTTENIHESFDSLSKFSVEPILIKCFQNSKQIFSGIMEEECKIASITWGKDYTYAISDDHKVFFWGRNKYGLNLKPTVSIEAKPLHLYSLDGKKFSQICTYENHALAIGHWIELTFSHVSVTDKFTMLGISNDYSIMGIDYFELKSEEVFIINDHEIPYSILKHKIKKCKMLKRDRQKLLYKLAKHDMEAFNQKDDDKAFDEDEEESESE